MKIVRTLACLASAAAIAATSMFAISPAHAASLPDEFVNEVRTVWTENGVSSATQDQLIAKLESGQTLDANLGIEPIEQQQTENGKYFKTVSTYADGSISVTDAQIPSTDQTSGGPSSRQFSKCKITWSPSVSKYRNCDVRGWFTAVSLAFNADIDVYATSTKIVGKNSPTQKCTAPLNCQVPQFENIKATGTNSSPAQLNLVTYYNSPLGGGTTRLILYSKPANPGYTN